MTFTFGDSKTAVNDMAVYVLLGILVVASTTDAFSTAALYITILLFALALIELGQAKGWWSK